MVDKLKSAFIVLMVLFASMMIVGLVSAADDELFFKSNAPIDLKMSCIVNGTYCAPTASCNLTVVKPSGEVILNNMPTTNQVSYYNYSLPGQDTLGDYGSKLVCYDPVAGFSGSQDFIFTITSTGKAGGSSLMLVLILFGAGIFLFALALKMHNEYVGFAAGGVFLTTGVYIMIYGLGVLSDFYTRAIAYVALGFGLLILIAAAYDAIDMGQTRLLGDPDDEDF